MNVMCGMLHDDCDSMPLLYESSGSNRTIIHITVEAAKFFDNDDSDNEIKCKCKYLREVEVSIVVVRLARASEHLYHTPCRAVSGHSALSAVGVWALSTECSGRLGTV